MQKELSSFGDHAEVTMRSNVVGAESVGIEGYYHVVCRDADGNIKWEEEFPNLVNAIGKELMLDTLLSGTSYTTVGPFLGLISGASPTFAAADTMASHGGWTEFTNYTVGGSAVRGTASFSAATSTGTTPTNVTTKTASARPPDPEEPPRRPSRAGAFEPGALAVPVCGELSLETDSVFSGLGAHRARSFCGQLGSR